MNINTKYNIGDKVLYRIPHSGYEHECIICGIHIDAEMWEEGLHTTVLYQVVGGFGYINELNIVKKIS